MGFRIIIEDDKPATREMQYSRCVVTNTLINISQGSKDHSLEIPCKIYEPVELKLHFSYRKAPYLRGNSQSPFATPVRSLQMKYLHTIHYRRITGFEVDGKKYVTWAKQNSTHRCTEASTRFSQLAFLCAAFILPNLCILGRFSVLPELFYLSLHGC